MYRSSYLRLWSSFLGPGNFKLYYTSSSRIFCTLPESLHDHGSITQLIKEFPQPKNVLHHALNQVSISLQTLIAQPNLKVQLNNETRKWIATLSMKWPHDFETKGISSKKCEAETIAYLLACQKIKDHGLLNEKNLLVVPQTASLNEKLTSSAKADLSNIFHLIWPKFGNRQLIPYYNTFVIEGLQGNSHIWKTELILKYPETKKFVALAFRSIDAEKLAASRALEWLLEKGVINEKKKLILYSSVEEKNLLKCQQLPCPLYIPEDLQSQMQQVLNNYKHLKEDHAWTIETFALSSAMESSGTGTIECTDVLTERPYRLLSDEEASKRNEFLFQKQHHIFNNDEENIKKILHTRTQLPVSNQRSEILKLIKENRVIVLSGETGCGKTTQVPQYILESFVDELKGSECNIVVTQPRRISAICIAEYVAYERGEKAGETVGYQVRLCKKLPRGHGAILFCSTGILLRKLIYNPNLEGVSHVIVDEAHERSVQIDFLLILLKKVLQTNKNIKVILMSASINTEMFSKYFDTCPIIHVPGFLYPVKEYYLEDILPNIGYDCNFKQEATLDVNLISKVICHVDSTQPAGAILCFLPGWNEIKSTLMQLRQMLRDDTKYLFCILHSRLIPEEQKKAFIHPPKGVRKIILSTNIAETSVTIDDVVYVINSGLQKQTSFDTDKAIAALGLEWITKSNVRQRKGRAGRVQPGICYHIFPKSLHSEMQMYPTPEIKRMPLEKVVLDCKLFCPDVKCEDFLSLALQPPSKLSIQLGILELQRIGLLNSEEQPTALGKSVLHFSTHPRLSKALVLATFFKCLDSVLTITALLTASRDPFSGIIEKEQIKNIKEEFDVSQISDHLALCGIFQQWDSIADEEVHSQFIERNKLDNDNLKYMKGLKGLFAEHLFDAGFLSDPSSFSTAEFDVNQNKDNPSLVFTTLASAFYPNIVKVVQGEISRGKLKKDTITYSTIQGQKVLIQSESVASKVNNLPSVYLSYFSAMESKARRQLMVPGVSPASPCSLLLFAGHELTIEKLPEADHGRFTIVLDGSKKLKFLCTNFDASLIQEWHQMCSQLIEIYVQKDIYNSNSVSSFLNTDFLPTLKKLLSIPHVPFRKDQRFYFSDGELLSNEI